MTLDKAIEVYEFWANAHERDAEYHRPLGYSHETTANVAEMQAREERQLAEWLKELKAYRETYPYGVEGYPPRADTPQTERPSCETCRYYSEEEYSDKCDKCVIEVGKRSNYEPQTEETCERCVYVRGSQWCQGCNGIPKRWDGEKIVDTPQTEMDKCYKCKWWNYSYGCSNKKGICDFEQADTPQTDCGWK